MRRWVGGWAATLRAEGRGLLRRGPALMTSQSSAGEFESGFGEPAGEGRRSRVSRRRRRGSGRTDDGLGPPERTVRRSAPGVGGRRRVAPTAGRGCASSSPLFPAPPRACRCVGLRFRSDPRAGSPDPSAGPLRAPPRPSAGSALGIGRPTRGEEGRQCLLSAPRVGVRRCWPAVPALGRQGSSECFGILKLPFIYLMMLARPFPVL